MGELEDQAGQLFETFIQASTCKGTLQAFNILCRQLDLDPSDYSAFYRNLKRAVTSWKATPLWNKLDKRASHKEYKKGTACPDTRCLIIGGGPCGLRTAIELALLGAKVVLIEKRDSFSRNNVLHLWPYTIHDLKELGAKKFYGKFCAGAIDHISIRQLQLMLMKIALIVGVEIHVKVEFVKLLEPPEDKGTDGPGWRAKVLPADHSLNDYEFDVIVGADGRRNTLDGFRRKEFRGKLAIAITANFVNRHTTAEAKVEEISGVAFIFNQKFFLDLKDDTGIDLENIVYYKDDTHYFVMTAKKQSLLDKGVIIRDHIETEKLLGSDNVNQDALLSYAREAADFGTDYQLPSLDYAINHQGKPDVAMFDFTSMYASENAALIREKAGHELLVALVGDSLLEPFWPMGTGCARGFLAAFDTAWMVRSWAQGKAPLEILSERESLYRLLPQTTPENISKNIEQYTIDPASRYPNLNSSCVRQHQVKHLYICGEQNSALLERGTTVRRSVKRRESDIRPSRLLTWCQRQTEGYRGVQVTDLSSSWRSGLALCALIHNFHPELIDFDSLNEENVEGNNQLGFDVAARELGIQPVTTGKEMASQPQPDKLMMVLYLSKFYEKFLGAENDAQQRKKRLQKDEKVEEQRAKRRREESAVHEAPSAESSVRSMQDLRARFENASSEVPSRLSDSEYDSDSDSDSCSESSPPPTSHPRPPTMDWTQNPRYAKPKDQTPPPSPPPKPKWQPSVYLRLLSEGSSPQTPKAATSPNSTIVPPPRPISPRSPSPSFSPFSPSCISHPPRSSSPPPKYVRLRIPLVLPPALQRERPRPREEEEEGDSPSRLHPSSSSSSSNSNSSSLSPSCSMSTPALSDMLQRQQHLEDQIEQRKAKTLTTREFSNKSIKDRAKHLFSMFPGEVARHKVYTPVYLPTPQPSPASNPSPPIFRSLSTPAPSCYSPIRTPSPPSPPPPPSSSIHHPMTSSSSSSSSSNSVHISSALSCLPLVPAVPEPSKQCNGAALSCELSQIHLSENDDIDSPTLSSHTQRTVGKVSSVIGAKAETLAHLYETDHRPKAAPAAPHSPGSTRREIPLTVGGSDVCHSCHKRVYVMERVCMEGYFFHRECFKCDECLCTLRQGGNAFNSGQGRFLCKLHYSQFLSNARNRGRTAESHPVSTLDGRAIGVGTPGTATGCSQQHRASEGQSYGAPRGRLNPSIVAPRGRLDPNIVAERPEETQVEPASALGNPGSSSDARPQTAESHSVPSSDSGSTSCSSSLSEEGKGQRSTSKGANKNHYWRRKIRATLPLILVKTFARGRATDNKQDGSTEDGESDFEEIHEHDHKEASSSSPSETPAGSQPQPAAEKKCPVAQPEVPTLTITTDDSQGLPERPDPHLTSSIPVSIATSSTTATATSSSTTSSTASSLASSSQLQPASQESHNDGHKKKEVELEQQQHQVSSNATNSPKKKLVLSTTEREKLLDWDVEPSEGSDPSLPPAGIRNGSCGPPALPADGKPPASGSLPQSAPPAPAAAVMATKRTPDAQAQNGPPPQSAFQIWASSLKRSLAGASSNRDTTSTSTTTTNVVRRGKVAPSRARPLSEGSFNIGSIFGNQNQQASSGGGQENLVTSSTTNTTTNSSSGLENGHAGQRRPDGGGGGGGELTELLQQVALSTSSKPTTKDDMAFLPRRKVNFFSSLRVKSQAEVERGRGGGADQNIWNILSKFRNKASTQTPVEEEEEDERASSSDDREDLPSDYHGDPRRKENVSERRRRRQERIVQQQAKREQLKRLHRAQTIQRQLEEVEETQRALEEKGVTLEKVLRGETDNKDMEDDPELLQTWFKLVLEKNKLQRYESELMIFAQELELEDTQSQLQQDLRHKMSIDDSMKTSADLSEEQRMLVEIMQVVEKRDQLVSLLEEQRLKERAEDQDLESMLLSKRYQLHWT
ncbi:F-actin-monooxygenase mical2b isoform X1 [Engraulis encrasicolus]|uniref:F-actin-monooxygenase mical2b isoform X1 n=1 Tax=Engraulis encrasicolus TaxID=184585 RepID=UPI002FD5A12B